MRSILQRASISRKKTADTDSSPLARILERQDPDEMRVFLRENSDVIDKSYTVEGSPVNFIAYVLSHNIQNENFMRVVIQSTQNKNNPSSNGKKKRNKTAIPSNMLMQRDASLKYPLHIAVCHKTSASVLQYLLDEMKSSSTTSSDLDQITAPGNWNPIHFACHTQTLDISAFQVLCQDSPRALRQVTEGRSSTPLHIALQSSGTDNEPKRLAMIQIMVKVSPNIIFVRNQKGETPIDLANKQNDVSVHDFLSMVHQMMKRKHLSRASVEERTTIVQEKLDKMKNSNLGNIPTATTASMSKSSGESSSNPSQKTIREYYSEMIVTEIELKVLSKMKQQLPTLKSLQEKHDELQEQIQSTEDFHTAQELRIQAHQIQLQIQREKTSQIPFQNIKCRKKLQERMEQNMGEPVVLSTQYLLDCTDGFSMENQLGRGGFGSVYKAFDKDAAITFAVKKSTRMDDPSLQREVDVLKLSSHPNIVRLLAIAHLEGSETPTHLVFEYAAGGTLDDVISSEDGRRSFTWPLRLSAAEGIASALAFLHHGIPDRTIIHHDLKPGNICFSDDLKRAILIDCGISKLNIDSMSTKAGMSGTVLYFPPEYTDDTPYDEVCEVYTFGLVLRVIFSGERIRKFNDRDCELIADSNAGEGDESVIGEFRKLIDKCTEDEPTNRPGSEKVAAELENLVQLLDRKTEISEEVENRMNEELQQSLTVSRASRSLTNQGVCVCSPNKKKTGLYCPQKRHFQCSGCLNKHVLDYLGEDIFCPMKGCKHEPFTLDEMHSHLRRSIMCRHVESIIKNRELAVYRKSNVDVMEQIGQGFERVMKGITALGRDELGCPLLAIMFPVRTESRVKLRSFMSNWTAATKKSFFLYFLCAYDYSMVPAPIRISVSREWVQKAAPFLRVVLAGLAVAVGVQFGHFPNLGFLGGDPGAQARKLEQMDEMLVAASGNHSADMDRFCDVITSKTLAERISPEAYQMVNQIANEPENLGWKNHMKLVEHNGELAWVRHLNVDAFVKGL